MKGLLVGFLLIGLSLNSYGADKTPPSAKDKENFCSSVSSLSEKIMSNRQQGVAMSKMLEVGQGADPTLYDLAKSIVMAAYEKPRFHTKENIQRSIEDFRDEFFLACVKRFQKD